MRDMRRARRGGLATIACAALLLVLVPVEANASTSSPFDVVIEFRRTSATCFPCSYTYEGAAVSAGVDPTGQPQILTWTFSLATQTSHFEELGSFTLQGPAGDSLAGTFRRFSVSSTPVVPLPYPTTYTVTAGTGSYAGCTSPTTSAIVDTTGVTSAVPGAIKTVHVVAITLTCG